LRAGTAFVVPFVARAVLRAGTALFADAFFTAMFGPFMVALRRPVALRRRIADEYSVVPTNADRWREDKAFLPTTQW